MIINNEADLEGALRRVLAVYNCTFERVHLQTNAVNYDRSISVGVFFKTDAGTPVRFGSEFRKSNIEPDLDQLSQFLVDQAFAQFYRRLALECATDDGDGK